MSTPARDYEYRGAKAAYWDLLRGDTSTWEDRPFYRAAIQESGQPVLDVGCGTGRLLLDFLAEGIDVEGVDNSPEMLDVCRQKAQPLGLRPVLFEQQMEDLQLPRTYRTIIVPSSSFQLIVDRTAAAEAMRRFFQHLAPGGRLVMPFMLIWEPPTDQASATTPEWMMRAEAIRPEDGAVVRRWSKAIFDLVNQLDHTEDRYELIRAGEVIDTEYQVRSPATRYYTQLQAVDLYRAAGFSHIRVVRGFTDAPAGETDRVFSVFGQRA
jgi:ubiquinone/menaquinone biosynthesis C-methylase UbiE